MSGTQVAAALLSVVIGSGSTLALAQGAGGAQPRTDQTVLMGLALDGIAMGRLVDSLQTQTAAGYEEKLVISPQAMNPAFFSTWIMPTLQGQRPMKTVRLTGMDRNGRVVSALDLPAIIPQKIEFPMLDASSHALLQIKVTLATARAIQVQGAVAPVGSSPTQNLRASAFRLQIPGIDTSHVMKIEAISFMPRSVNPAADLYRQPATSLAGGKDPLAGKGLPSAGAATISNLIILIPQTYAQPFQQWLATAPRQTRSGSIDYLGPDLRPSWGALSLQGLGITKISTRPGPGPNGMALTSVEMTIGGIHLVARP